MDLLNSLIQDLSRLPGIGRKSASRLAYYLLKADKTYAETLARKIIDIKHKIKSCSDCGNFTETDPCSICSSTTRDKKTICVIEQPQDIAVIEATREYRGLYHVLRGAISPIDGIGPDDLKISALMERISLLHTEEIILAMNPTVEGDTTALYLSRLLEKKNLKITRLALGLPVGGDLEYADRLTLTRALKGRTPF